MNSLFPNKKYKVVPIMEENVADLDRRTLKPLNNLIHDAFVHCFQIGIRISCSDVTLDQLERGEYIAK